MSKPSLAVITGPTGAGKSDLAIKCALAFGSEIINADSLALYRGFDIGTAKPSSAEQAAVKHHLIDVLDPDEDFDAAAYLRAARPLVEKISHKGILPLAVGGTGFYLRSLTAGLFEGPGRDNEFRAGLASQAAAGVNIHAQLAEVDPETAARLAPADYVRIERALEVYHLSGKPISLWQKEHALAEKPFKTIVIVIDRPKDELEKRIRKRTRRMFEMGLAAEVEYLLEQGWSPELKPFQSIGYKETLEYLRGEAGLEETMDKIIISTRRFAKRQRTWFRGQMPQACWFEASDESGVMEALANFFAK